ncbi:unnamed protein product [Durusdinium trenchii]|uniref:Gcp-like domain-containing protein n=1 Tax=Durusdinium trenchii TaxID=1381693 RepID=A0ABP0R0Z2_9DINO
MVAAIEKWKVGIPKMKAKVMSQEEFENFLEKSKTCLVFVKNLPEDCELDCSCTAPSQVYDRATALNHVALCKDWLASDPRQVATPFGARPDVDATEALGAALAHEAQRGDLFFLRGELGSGKTLFGKMFVSWSGPSVWENKSQVRLWTDGDEMVARSGQGAWRAGPVGEEKRWCQQAGAVDLSEVLEIEESFADALGRWALEGLRGEGRKRSAEPGPQQEKLDYKRATALPLRNSSAGDASDWMLGSLERTLQPCCLSRKCESSCSGRARVFFASDEDFVPSTLRADATGSFYPLKSKKQLEPDRRMCGDNSSSAVTFGCSGSSQATSLSSHQRVDDRFREHESFLQQQRLKAFKRRSEIEGRHGVIFRAVFFSLTWLLFAFVSQLVLLHSLRLIFNFMQGDEQAERALNLERQARREDGERLHPEQLFVFDKPGFLQPRKRMALPSLQFTWAATWWGIRVNQVKDSFGLRADDFIVEVAGVPLSELEEDVCEQTFQRYSHEGVQVLVEPSCSRWGSLPHMNVNFDSMCADIEALQLDYGAIDETVEEALRRAGISAAELSGVAVTVGQHVILGSTIDDSIGEAFDKTARVLGITQVPGGPHLERLAKDGDPKVHPLPKPLSKTRDKVLLEGCDYSFSGLKTAVRTLVEKELPSSKAAALSEEGLRKAQADIAAAFQKVAVQHLCERASRAAGCHRALA